ncbi:MAG: hypothetical protein NT116_05510 [Candidatus Parcubacteria bacterium]|nr:hypothetical protein [Candidatus Parcubacteria bacterium]
MLEDKDIQKLKEVFATKDDISNISRFILDVKDEAAIIKEEMAKKEDFVQLQTSVDNYAKKANDYFQEMAALNNKINRHENWIQQIANQLKINLEY